MFTPFGGTVSSVTFGLNKYLGLSFDPTGVGLNLGWAWGLEGYGFAMTGLPYNNSGSNP
jgi:hypothetical protein